MADRLDRGAAGAEREPAPFVVEVAGRAAAPAPWRASARATRVSIHLLPPPVRAQLLHDLQPLERLLLSRVCCDCATIRAAARQLRVTPEEAARLWRRVDALIAAAAGG